MFVPLKASISPDRLPADDERYLAVPVVASLPVVFVDQYGAEQEDAIQGRLGETRHLRKLLAPKTSRSDAPRQLVKVRHITPDELNAGRAGRRPAGVIAGVQSPQATWSDLLRHYVQQGGQLVIAAGANFDPAAWNDAAWLDGAGILPLPLAREPIGEVPEVAGANLQAVLACHFDSLAWRGLFSARERARGGAARSVCRAVLLQGGQRRCLARGARPLEAGRDEAAGRGVVAQGFHRQTKGGTAERVGAERRIRGGSPADWKPTKSDCASCGRRGSPGPARWKPKWIAVLPDRSSRARAHIWKRWSSAKSPSVLARFDLEDRPPFLVSRKIGRGEVIFCSSGLLSSWNTLPKTNAVLIFDRILREHGSGDAAAAELRGDRPH